MEDVGIFYGHLVYIFYRLLVFFIDIWYIFGNFVYFPPFWYVVPRNIWQHCNQHVVQVLQTR
jgi:hypothetical protein